MSINYTSHSQEPEIGEKIINTNPGCQHAGSEGTVLSVDDLGDPGKVVTYQCDNSGPSWDEGEILQKTLDQVAPLLLMKGLQGEAALKRRLGARISSLQESDLSSPYLQTGSKPSDFDNFPSRIFERDHVVHVLGLDYPLLESDTLSEDFRNRVMREQLMMEGFFADAKKLGADLMNATVALRYIIEDPSRIKAYVAIMKKQVQEKVTQALDWIKEVVSKVEIIEVFLEKIADLARKIYDFIKGVIDKVKTVINFVKDKFEATIKKIMSLAGWKLALGASVALVGAAYIYDKLQEQNTIKEGLASAEDGMKQAEPFIEKAKEYLASRKGKEKKEESFYSEFPLLADSAALSLSETLYGEEERLDEFLGLFKKGAKKKDAEEEKADDKEEDKGKEAAPEGEETAGEDEGGGVIAQLKEALVTIRDIIKEQVMAYVKELTEKAQEAFKKFAVGAITTAVGGGVVKFFGYCKSAFDGLKFVFQYLGPPLKQFAAKMKGDKEIDLEAESAELVAGEDDPTDPKSKKESVYIAATDLRKIIREQLIAEAIV